MIGSSLIVSNVQVLELILLPARQRDCLFHLSSFPGYKTSAFFPQSQFRVVSEIHHSHSTWSNTFCLLFRLFQTHLLFCPSSTEIRSFGKIYIPSSSCIVYGSYNDNSRSHASVNTRLLYLSFKLFSHTNNEFLLLLKA